MRKSGLHKQVAFIFEGEAGLDRTASSGSEVCAGDSSSGGLDPERAPSRPRPAPKAVPSAAANAAPKGRSAAARKSSPTDDASAGRQRKMLVVVGVLSVLFVVVLMFSFGGIGQSKAAPVVTDEAVDAPPAARFNPDSWAIPEPLPEQMRNPLVLPPPPAAAGEDAEPIDQAGNPVVRGIVYSRTRPSAIIGEQIVFEGQTLYDVTVIKITHDAVEFERDGKRWTQRVQ